MSDGLYRFGDIQLNWNTRELFRQETLVAIEPKALELIHYLLRHRDRAVGKDELAEALWPRRVISDSVISQTVRKARIALADDGDRQAVIATVRGYGYRFVAAVTDQPAAGQTARPGVQTAAEQELAAAGRTRYGLRPMPNRLATYLGVLLLLVAAIAAISSRLSPDAERYFNPAWAKPDQPALVAMLPFHHDQSSVRDRALAQSLAEALHMRLAEFPGIEVRSPRVVGLLLEDEPALADLLASAEVDFLLSGTLEPALAVDRRELGLELAFKRDGILQAIPLGRFSIRYPDSSESLAEFMQERDAIIHRLTQTLMPAMAPPLADSPLGTHRSDAFRLLLAAVSEVRAVKCDSREVDGLLRRAIEIDPEFHYARLALAWVDYMQYRNCGQRTEHLFAAAEQIERVLSASAEHPVALLINTLIQVETGMIEEACERLAPALRRYPTSPQLRLSFAHALTFAGFLDAAATELDALIAADPLFLSFEKPHLPLAYFYLGRHEDFLRAAPSLDVPSFRYYRALAELERGDESAARALLQPASLGNPVDLAVRMSEALLAILDGRLERALAIVESIGTDSTAGSGLNGESLFQLARLLHQAGGAQDRALDRLEDALAAGFFCLACLEKDTQLSALAEHPRWVAILVAAQERQLAMAERLGSGPMLSRRQQSGHQLAHGGP